MKKWKETNKNFFCAHLFWLFLSKFSTEQLRSLCWNKIENGQWSFKTKVRKRNSYLFLFNPRPINLKIFRQNSSVGGLPWYQPYKNMTFSKSGFWKNPVVWISRWWKINQMTNKMKHFTIWLFFAIYFFSTYRRFMPGLTSTCLSPV